ncbi:MAG TPA: hypothetical protein VGM98_00540 [Schlesneria sp.]|jgi:hypothetical protein
MHEFFRGWRRKAGIVTLVTAGVMFVVWMRSLTTYDAIHCKLPWVSSSSEDREYDSDILASFDGMLLNRRVFSAPEGFRDEDIWAIPHWSIVLPLTLLSAYLLLWKPRKRDA